STVRAQLEQGGPVASLCLVVAAWMRYALGRDEQGREIDVSDPLADRFAAIAAGTSKDPANLADRVLEIREMFGVDLPQDRRVRWTVTGSLRQLVEYGALEAVTRFVRSGHGARRSHRRFSGPDLAMTSASPPGHCVQAKQSPDSL